MKYITHYMQALIMMLLLSMSQQVLAIELLDASIPAQLKNAYHGRYSAPDSCIEITSRYIKNQQSIAPNSAPITDETIQLNAAEAVPLQLLAFCYAQVEDYHQAYLLLADLLKKQDFSIEEIRTLNILAADIPEEDRPEFSNAKIIKALSKSLTKLQQQTIPPPPPHLIPNVLLTISKLSLQSDLYRDANEALEAAKSHLKTIPSTKLNAWLAYYYGIYYEKINQQQLAISNLLTANELANKHNFIKLSGESKKSLSMLYQQKHVFDRAIDFANQRIELYNNTTNTIKQADSLIFLAILKRQNKQRNEARIYLFNALELIQHNKHSILLAQVYFELGRTYSSDINHKENAKEHLLAQKYLQNARYHFSRLNKVRYQVESLLLLARLNIIYDDPALAILQLEKALRLSKGRYPSLQVQAFEMLASSYEITGNHQQAILHFKNFHALQNRIKENQFTLQQLKVNEQLQLVEQTQNQRQLEIEIAELQKTTMRFKTLAQGAIPLLIIAVLIIFYILIRNRKLKDSEQRAQQQLNFHPRTNLPSQQSQGIEFNYIYREKPLFYALVNIPFLTQINELSGLFIGTKLEEKLGAALAIFFTNNADIFQIRDNQILFISEQSKQKNACEFAGKIEQFFTLFTEQYHLPNKISTGIVAFPFLNNVSRAITPTRMLNLSSLALFAATQLRENYQENSWVELFAIDNLQPAFFDGDLWILGQSAIKKGIVKVNSSRNEHHFHWPELDK